MAQLAAEEQGRLGGASSGILPTHWAKSGVRRTAWTEAASRKSSPAGETWNLEDVAIHQKHNLVKWSVSGKSKSPSGTRSRKAGLQKAQRMCRNPSHRPGFKSSTSSTSCGAMARSIFWGLKKKVGNESPSGTWSCTAATHFSVICQTRVCSHLRAFSFINRIETCFFQKQ